MRYQRSRRALALAAVGVLALTACGGDKKEEPTGATTGGAGAVSGEVEVFSWWTGGGEAKGLEAMIADFKTKYPNVEFVNAASPAVPAPTRRRCWRADCRPTTRRTRSKATPVPS